MTPHARRSRRDGRCYQLSFSEVLDAPPHWQLVHGVVDGPGGIRINHAWLEADGSVQDPVLGLTFAANTYYAKYDAKPVKRYTQREAASLGRRQRHYGPWGTP